MFDQSFSLQPISESFKLQLWLALAAIMMAIMVLTSIAIAASTRLGQVMTLCVTIGVFMLGLLSDSMLGQPIKQLDDMWLQRASAAGLTETIEDIRIIELDTGQINQTVVDKEVATVALTQMADGLGERLAHAAYWVAYSILPNFQKFWLSDALTQSRVIPPALLRQVLLYGLFYIVAALSLATILFQRREVG